MGKEIMKKWWWNGNLKLLHPMFAQLWVQQVRPDEKAYYIIPADRWEKLRELAEAQRPTVNSKEQPVKIFMNYCELRAAIEAIEGEA